jgi:hypothetical protein
MHHQMSAEMQACMDACHHCHITCLSMTTQHCLQVGGAHAAPDHIKIMLDCAQVCATSLDFMARGSDQHKGSLHESALCVRQARTNSERHGSVVRRQADFGMVESCL